MGQIRQFINLLKQAKGNAVWDGIKWLWEQRNLGGATMVALVTGITGWIRHLSGLAGYFRGSHKNGIKGALEHLLENLT